CPSTEMIAIRSIGPPCHRTLVIVSEPRVGHSRKENGVPDLGYSPMMDQETPTTLTPSHHAALTPDTPAIIMASTGETTTYAELDDRSIRLPRPRRERR